MEQQYWCDFVNKRSMPTTVRTPDGWEVITLMPNSKSRLCMHDPRVAYARFSRVVYYEGGKVAVDLNRDWRPIIPDDCRPIELENQTATEQTVRIDEAWVTAIPGVPMIVPVRLTNPLIEFSKITWREVERKYHREDDERYLETVKREEMVREARPEKELREIRKIIAADLAEQAEKDLDRAFPSLAKK